MSEKYLFIAMPDPVAKLVMGQLLDVGVPFSYRRVPASPMAAMITVSQARFDTLTKVHTLMVARLKRSQVSE